MAKKKPISKNTEPQFVPSEIGNETHDHTHDEIYHATFTPTWRTEVDCGDHATLEEAQQAVVDVGGEFDADVIPAWHRESPDVWLATGHDGRHDTTMMIARIVRTVGE